LLQKFGAAISIDPRDAQVILVNPESTQGRLFVRNWGHDTDKVVLDSAWAKKCFEAQKALLEDDEYGGYLLMDDGRPLEGDENEESEDEIKQSVCFVHMRCLGTKSLSALHVKKSFAYTTGNPNRTCSIAIKG
jgi:hypothetical protein